MAALGFKFRRIGYQIPATPNLPWKNNTYAAHGRKGAVMHVLASRYIFGPPRDVSLFHLHLVATRTECCHKNHQFKSTGWTTTSWLQPTPLFMAPSFQTTSLLTVNPFMPMTKIPQIWAPIQSSSKSPHFCQIEQYGLLIWFSTLDFFFLPSLISLFLPLLHFMSDHQSLLLIRVPGNSIQVSSTPTQVPHLIPGLLEELPHQSPYSILSTVRFHSFTHIFT